MKKYILTIGLLTILSLVELKARQQPNIIMVLVDDLGWGDLGCYGNDMPNITPNIDSWAADGIRFNQAYSGGSVCSPSRATLLTGRYPASVRIPGQIAPDAALNIQRGIDPFLSLEFPTMAQHFQDAGYYTGHLGKWHLTEAGNPDAPPLSSYGYSYYRSDAFNDPNRISEKIWSYRSRPTSTSFLVDETMKFIASAPQDTPFFLNLWLVDLHAKLNPSQEQMDEVQSCCSGGKQLSSNEQVYFGTLHEMDKQMGRLISYLKNNGLYENTIIVLSSDNGPEVIETKEAANAGVGKTNDLRGRKRSLYEGGIRVPFIASWPNHIPSNKVNEQTLFHGADVWPTLASLAEIPGDLPDDLDGENLDLALKGEEIERKKSLIWEWKYNIPGKIYDKSLPLIIRRGRWKLFVNPDSLNNFEVFDIESNPHEDTNITTDFDSEIFDMYRELLEWYKETYGSTFDSTSVEITPSLINTAVLGVAYNQPLRQTGLTDAATWSVLNGALPIGLDIDPITGSINGIPEETGVFNFSVQVAKGIHRGIGQYTLEVVCPKAEITPTQLPNGTIGEPYYIALSATDLIKKLTWAVASGALPEGLSLDSENGIIQGVPTNEYNNNFSISVSNGQCTIDSPPLTIIVQKAHQSILFDPIPKYYFGDESFQLNATSSSGLPIHYESSDTNKIRIIDGEAFILDVGTAVITAIQEGNHQFLPATPISQIVNIGINAPTGVSAIYNASGNIAIAWNATLGAESYTVLRSTKPDTQYEIISFGSLNSTSFIDTNTENTQDSTFYYAVKALNKDIISEISEAASISASIPILYKDFSDKTHIYPSPTSGLCRIRFDSLSQVTIAISLINASGKELWTRHYPVIDYECTVDFTSHAEGLYLLKIQAHESISFKKIIIK